MAGRLFIFQHAKLYANLPKAASVTVVIKRDFQEVVHEQHDNLTAYRRGTGGPASFSGVVATVFGATGFLGTYVVNRLAQMGSQIIIPYRGDDYYVRELKTAGEIGQKLFLPYHLRDEESIRKCVKYSNVVINLVGRDYETRNFTFDAVNLEGAQRLARIARESGVEKFIHISHLNAQPHPPSKYVKGGSKYLKSKYYSELAVQEEFPDATVIRCADVWGEEDRFLSYYGSWTRRFLNMMPLYKRGLETIRRPIFCIDVARGIASAIQDPSVFGQTYEFYGPKAYYLCDLIDYFYRCMRWDRILTTFVNPLFMLKVKLIHRLSFYPDLGMDTLARECVSDDIAYLPDLASLGVHDLKPIEDRAWFYLLRYRKYNHYDPIPGELPEPEHPPYIQF